jgi:RND family efflux transporter MFP subunit
MFAILSKLALLGFFALFADMPVIAQDHLPPSAQVQTISLRQQTFEETVKGFGMVGTTEEMMADISFPHPGQIADLKVRLGEKVTRGQELVAITADPATLESYHKALAALDFAERDLTRTKTLLAEHLATNGQVAAAQKAVADASSDVTAQRNLGNDQPFRVAAAPFDGYVAKVMSAPAERLQANTVVMQLARTDQGMRVTVGLKPDDAGRVEPGMPARVVPVLGNDQREFSGRVRQISGMLNPTSRLLDAWIDITQQGTKLVPGTSAAVTIIVAEHTGWAVPRNAVLRDDEGSYLFQVSNSEAHRVNVKTGVENDQATEVTGSFDPALKVVTSGNYELRDGMAVRETPASQP